MNMFVQHYENPGGRPATATSSTGSRTTTKIRSACDYCHHGKTRCSGGQPCAACADSGSQCVYSAYNKLGRPKGSKNKRTLERIQSQASNPGNTNNANASGYGLQQQKQHPPPSQQQQPPQHQFQTPLSNPEVDTTFEPFFIEKPGNDYIGQPLSASLSPNDFWDLSGGFDFSVGGRDIQSISEKASPTAAAPRALSLSDLHGNSGPPSLCGSSNSISMSSIETPPSLDVAGYSSLFNDMKTPGLATSSRGNQRPFGSQQLNQNPSSAEHLAMASLETSAMQSLALSGSAGTSACNCLMQHIKLLYQVEDLGQAPPHSALDMVLVSVRRAIETWNNLIQCRTCQRSGNQGVILLFAMSIRTLLRSLKHTSTSNVEQCRLASARMAAENPASFDASVHAPQLSASCKWRVALGQYDAIGACERRAVADTLIKVAVRRIELALEYLRRRIDTVGEDSSESLGDFSLFEGLNDEGYRTLFRDLSFDDHVEALLRNLDGIMRKMRNGGEAEGDAMELTR